MFTGSKSRHLLCRLVKDIDGAIAFARRTPVRYRADPGNRLHPVVAGETFQSIAELYFGSFRDAANLWWIIPDYQDPPIIDPTLALQPGERLVIPPDSFLLEVFSPSRRDVVELF